jgi:hypothetical protein
MNFVAVSNSKPARPQSHIPADLQSVGIWLCDCVALQITIQKMYCTG